MAIDEGSVLFSSRCPVETSNRTSLLMLPRQFSAFHHAQPFGRLGIQHGSPSTRAPNPSGNFRAILSGVSVSEVTVLNEILPPTRGPYLPGEPALLTRPSAPYCTAETDSALEGSGLELSVPRQIGERFRDFVRDGAERLRGAAASSEHSPASAEDRFSPAEYGRTSADRAAPTPNSRLVLWVPIADVNPPVGQVFSR